MEGCAPGTGPLSQEEVAERVPPQSLRSSPLPGSRKLGKCSPITSFYVLLLKTGDLNVVVS